jgi:hypothetical protein
VLHNEQFLLPRESSACGFSRERFAVHDAGLRGLHSLLSVDTEKPVFVNQAWVIHFERLSWSRLRPQTLRAEASGQIFDGCSSPESAQHLEAKWASRCMKRELK